MKKIQEIWKYYAEHGFRHRNQACTDSGTTVLSRRVVDPLPIGYMPHNNKPATRSVAKAPAKKQPHKNSVAAAPQRTETSNVLKISATAKINY